MAANYSLFKNPGKEGKEDGETRLHARLVNQNTIRMDKLAEEISDICSFSSADVKGMLEAFKSRLAFHMKYGDIVELEGLGTFAVSLKCPSLTDEKSIKPHCVKFSKVVFRSSKELKMKLRDMKVERASGGSRIKGLSDEKRKANILSFLKNENTISSSECRGLNGCSKYVALKDLKVLLAKGLIVRLGYRTNAQYALKIDGDTE